MTDKPVNRTPIWTPKPETKPMVGVMCPIRAIPVGIMGQHQQTGQLTPEGSVMDVPCIEAHCGFWDKEDKQCIKITEGRATKTIATILKQIDGFLRLPSDTE